MRTCTYLVQWRRGNGESPFISILAKLAILLALLNGRTPGVSAGTWSDDFSGPGLSPAWSGDTNNFSILDGVLNGISASPLAPVPLRWIEVGNDCDNYQVQCRINVVTPNLLVCTKGALVLRHRGNEGYVFALHAATQTIEVFRLSDHQMLLAQAAPLELKRWYRVRAQLQGGQMSFFVDDQLIGAIADNRSTTGAVGLAVQDALSVLFDDFSITGPGIPDNGFNISISQGKIILVWPNSMPSSSLQTTTSLTPPIQWTTLTNVPTVASNQNVLTLNPLPAGQFFRFSLAQ